MTSIDHFAGFGPATIRFLNELATHNERTWFAEHKGDYERDLLRPLQSLAADLGPTLAAIDPEIEIAPVVGKTIARTQRDTRFSHDKSPYKTTHWITFKRPRKDWQDAPAYFFELSANGYRYGMGFYLASRPTMDALRQRIDARPAEFRTAIACLDEPNPFAIEGDTYHRPLRRDLPPDFEPWYHRKNLYLAAHGICDETGIPGALLHMLAREFTRISPLYDYLLRTCPSYRDRLQAR